MLTQIAHRTITHIYETQLVSPTFPLTHLICFNVFKINKSIAVNIIALLDLHLYCYQYMLECTIFFIIDVLGGLETV